MADYEAWSFIYAKQKNVATAKAVPDGAGDVWTWIAMEAYLEALEGAFGADIDYAQLVTAQRQRRSRAATARPNASALASRGLKAHPIRNISAHLTSSARTSH